MNAKFTFLFYLQKNFSSSRRDESCQRLSEEPREREAETAVHRVGRQLQRHLANVVLHFLILGNVRVLEQVFDGPTRIHQLSDFRRQNAGIRA